MSQAQRGGDGGSYRSGGNSGGGATPVYMESVLRLPDSLVGKTVQFNWSVNSAVVVTPHIFRVDDVRILASPQCQASCSVKNPHTKQADFDGDGRADLIAGVFAITPLNNTPKTIEVDSFSMVVATEEPLMSAAPCTERAERRER